MYEFYFVKFVQKPQTFKSQANPPPRSPPPRFHHHHEADALYFLIKTPGLYLVAELRYPCHLCRCPPPHYCHHHEADALQGHP